MSGSNPFSAAFANEDEDDIGLMNHSPYQLGSIYGEDSLSLLEHEYSRGDVEDGLSSTAKKKRPPPPPPIQRGPPLKKTSCEVFMELFLCYNELQLFRKVDHDIVDVQARKITKQGFILHWISLAAFVTNFALFSLLFFSRTPESGPQKDTIPSLFSLIWSIVYLIVGGLYGWVFCTKTLFQNLRTGSTPSWWWFKMYSYIFLLFTVYLLVGLPGAGSGGLIALVQMVHWIPTPPIAIALSTVFTSLQVTVVIFYFILLRQVQNYADSQGVL